PSPIQRLFDTLQLDDAQPADELLLDVQHLMLDVKALDFPQAQAWAKARTPMRSVVAEVGEKLSLSVLVLPRGTSLEWHGHNKADSLTKLLFGCTRITTMELQPDSARKLEQDEVKVIFGDAWAEGGSSDSDCVCRGGRCPRMWDCPFWVDRRRRESKGNRALVSLLFPVDGDKYSGLWRATRTTVRQVQASESSALLEVHLGSNSLRHYKEIEARSPGATELVEVLHPVGVTPGFCSYLGPRIVMH
ncbi:unnamed protein product, partial [Discosporangium mesarthrocarpum]